MSTARWGSTRPSAAHAAPCPALFCSATKSMSPFARGAPDDLSAEAPTASRFYRLGGGGGVTVIGGGGASPFRPWGMPLVWRGGRLAGVAGAHLGDDLKGEDALVADHAVGVLRAPGHGISPVPGRSCALCLSGGCGRCAP